MRHTTVLALLALLSAHSHGVSAQPAGGSPISKSLAQAWGSGKDNVTASAALMPAANYAFRPVDTVRTYGQILAHLAGANYVFCAAAKGEKAPYGEDAFEKTATTKADIIKALGDSVAYCDAVYSGMTDARAAETVELPFGMGKGTRSFLLMLNTGHVQEHYGNLVTYLRIKGLVPPSSAPRR